MRKHNTITYGRMWYIFKRNHCQEYPYFPVKSYPFWSRKVSYANLRMYLWVVYAEFILPNDKRINRNSSNLTTYGRSYSSLEVIMFGVKVIFNTHHSSVRKNLG